MKQKTIPVRLKRRGGSDRYVVSSLKNTVKITVGDREFRVNDSLSEDETRKLCRNEKYNVSIS